MYILISIVYIENKKSNVKIILKSPEYRNPYTTQLFYICTLLQISRLIDLKI